MTHGRLMRSVIVCGLTLGASWAGAQESPAKPKAKPAAIGPAVARPSHLPTANVLRTTTVQPVELTTARGVVRAVREATLASRLAARITDMPLAEGRSFKKGDLLVAFDCERQSAEARAAAAAVQVQVKTVETNRELDKFNSIGKNDLLISISQLDKATAEAEALNATLKDCKLYAPFAGRVSQHLARNFEAVSMSQPLIRVVDSSELEVELIVPSHWLQWLAPGQRFSFQLDETGTQLTSTISRIAPNVDPVSKTVRVVGQIKAAEGSGQRRAVLPGMSGMAQFTPPKS